MEDRKKTVSFIKSVDICLDLIELLVTNQYDFGVREAARALELPKSTVYRYLLALEQRKILEVDPASKKYRIGLNLYRLASMALAGVELRKISLPYMEELRDKTNETVYLYIYEYDYITYVEKVDCSHTVRHVLEIGKAYPLPLGASGKAILAFLPEEEVDRILSKTKIPPATPRTITDPNKLKESLPEIRKKGFVLTFGERVPDVAGITAPIFSQQKKVIGGINLTIPISRFEQEKSLAYSKLVKECARKISLKMGYLPGKESEYK